MPQHWESCRAILTIQGRGPVRCWLPPTPGGGAYCPAHDPSVGVGAAGAAEPGPIQPAERVLEPRGERVADAAWGPSRTGFRQKPVHRHAACLGESLKHVTTAEPRRYPSARPLRLVDGAPARRQVPGPAHG
jgi:hypothetical protein